MSGCKVCKVLEKRNCEYLDDRLVEQWTAPKPERKGYRQLARWLNVTLLRREMDRAGLSTLAGEAESKYDRLTDNSMLAAELENSLASQGIAIDELQDDFVSYGVVRRHLKECLGAEYEEEIESDWEPTAIDIATEQAEEKISEGVQSLVNKDDLPASGDITVHVTPEVECNQCHTRVDIDRALRRGYICSCDNSG